MARKLRHRDPEGDMAKAQLQKIEMYAAKLNDMIHPDDELEAWVQSKLSRVASDMGDVKHYLDYEIKKIFIDKESLEERGLVLSDLQELVWEDEDEDYAEKSSINLVSRLELSEIMNNQDVVLSF